MPVIDQPKRFNRSHKLLFAALGVALLAVGVGVYVFWQDSVREKQPMDPVLVSFKAGRLSQSDPSTQGRLEAAAKEAQRKVDKIALWQAAASAANVNASYTDAERNALEAEKLGTTSSANALSLALLYQNRLNKPSDALKYYKLGLDRYKEEQKGKSDARSAKQIEFIETQIRALEAQGA